MSNIAHRSGTVDTVRAPFLNLRSDSPDSTRSIAGRLAALLRPGDVLTLTGEMGTGKTTFVQGLVAGLGSPERAVSPTFTIMREYTGGRFPILHADLYRCETAGEVADLGIDHMLQSPWVAVIEWGERSGPIISPDALEVTFSYVDEIGEDARVVGFRTIGEWQQRLREFAEERH